MKKTCALFAFLILSAFLFASCDSDSSSESEAPTAEAPATEEAAPAMVEVADDGTQFDPPVRPEQLPDGVYYCDMGTVHYARATNSQHRCPLCNMMLTYKGDAPAGHNHDHHGHDHDHDHDHAHGDDHNHDH